MFPAFSNIDSTPNESNKNLGDSYLDSLLTYIIESNESLNSKEISLTNYLNSIGLNNKTQEFINYIYNGYSSTNIIYRISLSSVSPMYRHYTLCKFLCQNNIRELNYIPNSEMLTNIWSSLFLEAISNYNKFDVNYQLLSNGNTLLMMVVQKSMYTCVKALCAHNAYVNLRNHMNKSVFHFLNSVGSTCDEHFKIVNLLNYCSSRDKNIFINSKITPDWTCYNQDKYSNVYSCDGSGSGGGGGSESCSQKESRYSAGYKGMTSDGCGAIYSGFNF